MTHVRLHSGVLLNIFELIVVTPNSVYNIHTHCITSCVTKDYDCILKVLETRKEYLELFSSKTDNPKE
jgi:hypothetical protein